jgi:hypothetical protein
MRLSRREVEKFAAQRLEETARRRVRGKRPQIRSFAPTRLHDCPGQQADVAPKFSATISLRMRHAVCGKV